MQNTQTSAFSSMFLFFLSYFDTTKRFNKSDKTVNFKCSWSTAAILHYYFFFFIYQLIYQQTDVENFLNFMMR